MVIIRLICDLRRFLISIVFHYNDGDIFFVLNFIHSIIGQIINCYFVRPNNNEKQNKTIQIMMKLRTKQVAFVKYLGFFVLFCLNKYPKLYRSY